MTSADELFGGEDFWHKLPKMISRPGLISDGIDVREFPGASSRLSGNRGSDGCNR
jgi:hypothetical protein